MFELDLKKLSYCFLFLVQISFSQNGSSDSYKLCVAIQSSNFISDSEAQNAVQKIMSVIGLSEQPILQACDRINNAVAISYRGQRYILYDPKFMKSLSRNVDNYWSNLFILAHEIGHHVNGHSLDILLYSSGNIDNKSLEDKRLQELQADEFAGFVLSKLGASINDSTSLFNNLPDIPNENYSTHPGKEKRIAAVKKGYERNGINYDNSQLLNYSLTENISNNVINAWDGVIEKVKKERLKQIEDPFDRIKVINDEFVPDESSTSWVYGSVINNDEPDFKSPKLIIYQEKFENENKIYKQLFLQDSYFNQLVLSRIPEIYRKTALNYINEGDFWIDYIFDNGSCGAFYTVKNKKGWELVPSCRNLSDDICADCDYKSFYENMKNNSQLFIKISEIDFGFINGIEEFINIEKLESNIKTHQFSLKGVSEFLSF